MAGITRAVDLGNLRSSQHLLLKLAREVETFVQKGQRSCLIRPRDTLEIVLKLFRSGVDVLEELAGGELFVVVAEQCKRIWGVFGHLPTECEDVDAGLVLRQDRWVVETR